ncbi:MAG: transglutaminase domain-containing protein [Candidatus Micrarchaeota archaeon]|nr:transglutaminase domain-containing protein [Candidatus Micrarchaeota archaeon]
MQKRTFALVLITIAMFVVLALELKYIEDSLISATIDTDRRCDQVCAEEGKAGYLIDGYCNCRKPVSFSKRWICFWNITPGEEKSISYNAFKKEKRKRIPIYPSDVFRAKVDPIGIRNYAVSAVSHLSDSNDITTKIFGIYEYVADRVSYVSDPIGDEYVAFPNETIESGGGDCDDYAILLASMYESVGLKPMMVQARNDKYGHIFLILPVEGTLNSFLEKYKNLMERYTDYSGELPFNFIIFGTSKEHCEGINRNLADGGDINSFNIIIDGTSRDYPGSSNPADGYDFIKFIPL